MAASPARGFTLFMTGLPSAGKTTLAGALRDAVEKTGRTATVLDGDVVREMLSSGLTFSREDRELNIRRIGYVAGEVTRHGGVCICAAIAPYASARAEARERVAQYGGFFEIFVSTPLAVCETRDTKGLYGRARRGELRGMTGIDDPFEPPAKPDVAVDTSKMTPAQAVEKILALPRKAGLLG
jgi:sulfate adenylyltransferase